MKNTVIYLIGPPGVGKYTVARLLTVNLRYEESELLSRVTDPGRRSRMKDIYPDNAELAKLPDYVPDGADDHVVIDTTALSASSVAEKILDEL